MEKRCGQKLLVLSLGVSTVETSPYQVWLFSTPKDVVFEAVNFALTTVETLFWSLFIKISIALIKTFPSILFIRLKLFSKTNETNWD